MSHFSKFLEVGKSKPWPIVLRKLTGRKRMSTKPMRQFFAPLMDWLKKYRQEKGYKIGWADSLSKNPLKPKGAKKSMLQ